MRRHFCHIASVSRGTPSTDSYNQTTLTYETVATHVPGLLAEGPTEHIEDDTALDMIKHTHRFVSDISANIQEDDLLDITVDGTARQFRVVRVSRPRTGTRHYHKTASLLEVR